jgi:hypothetical protein
MVQPFMPSVDIHGETGALVFNGKFSHAFTKGAFLEVGGSLKGGEYTENFSFVKLEADQEELVK